MVIYHYVERVGEFSLSLICSYSMYDHQKYYPGEPVTIHIRSLINMTQEENCLITTKRGRGELSLFCGNREWVIPFYGVDVGDSRAFI